MQTLMPVKNAEREIFMDVLRNFVMPGIFIAILAGFTWYNDAAKPTGPSLITGWIFTDP